MRCSTTCGICEFEARKLSILDDHLEIRHMKKKTLWGQQSQKTEHYCEKCGKELKNLFVKRFHLGSLWCSGQMEQPGCSRVQALPFCSVLFCSERK
jgi:hypothetical protein